MELSSSQIYLSLYIFLTNEIEETRIEKKSPYQFIHYNYNKGIKALSSFVLLQLIEENTLSESRPNINYQINDLFFILRTTILPFRLL